MGLIWSMTITIGGLVAAAAVSTVARLLADDAKEWLPWLTSLLVKRAIQRLPKDERERFTEEWWSHINEWPGNFAKLYVAFGYLSASSSIKKITRIDRKFLVSKPRKEFLRRTADILLSTVLLLVLAPIMILLIAIIKIETPGPALYVGIYFGQNGKNFRLLKFRCLHCKKDNNFVSSKSSHTRLTRVGRLLQASSLDELPQLINVVCGDMSLIGPRALPEIDSGTISLIREIVPEYNKGPTVKPGITGWSQIILYNRKIDTLNYLRLSFIYDQFYINRRNLRFDIDIIILVIKKTFSYKRN